MSARLTTAGVVLRPLTDADAANVVALHTDPEVLRHLGRPASAETVLADELPRLLGSDPHAGHPSYLAAEERGTATLLGWFELRPVGEPGCGQEAPTVLELGYRLRRDA